MKLEQSMKSYSKEALKPEYMVLYAYAVFLLMAYASYKIPATGIYLISSFSNTPGLRPYILSLLGLLAIYFSLGLGRKLRFNHMLILAVIIFLASAVVYLTLKIPFILSLMAGIGYGGLLFYLSSQRDYGRLIIISFGLAIFSALTILIGGLPILSAGAREVTAVSTSRALFHGFGVFTASLIMGFYGRRKAIPAVTLLAVVGLLSGFKSDAIAVLLSAALAGLMLKKISVKEALLAPFAVLLILTAASTFIARVSYDTWRIPPLLYPFYRFGFTFGVYSKIVGMSMPFGFLGGHAILSTTQEIVSTAVLNYSEPHIITSTLFGPLTLDFGVLGLAATAVFIGGYLGSLKTDSVLKTCLYSMALVHILILIEVGLQLTSIMFLLSIKYLSMKS